MTGMRCAACGYEQFGEFPSFMTHCFADTNVHATKLERIALELCRVPNSEAGDRVIAVYACPNCGTLRIRIKGLKQED